MEKYVKGDSYMRSMSVQETIVAINHVSDVKDGKYYMRTKIDLKNMDKDLIYKHAAMNILIQIIRTRYLKLRTSSQIDESIVHDPTSYPAAKGGGVNKREMSIRTLMELGFAKSDAEFAVDNPEKAKQILQGRTKLRKNGNNHKNGKNHNNGNNTKK